MSKGIVLLAFGKPCYGRAAFNMAVSIKHFDPQVKIALLRDHAAFAKNHFDFSVFDEQIFLNETDLSNPGLIKTKIYDYLPFDHNLYLDVDGIALQSCEKLLNDLSEGKDYFKTKIFTTYDSTSPNELPEMIWAHRETIWNHYKLNGQKLPATQSSIQYIRKCDESEKLFKQWQKNIEENPIPVNQLRYAWGGGQPDELYLNVALAQMGIAPDIGPDAMFFGNKNRSKENLHEIQKRCIFLSIYGGKGFINSTYTDWYDKLLIKYCFARGHNHVFKIPTIYDGKHSGQKTNHNNQKPTVHVPVQNDFDPNIKINLFVCWYNAEGKRCQELLNILQLNKNCNIFLVSEQPFRDIPLETIAGCISVKERPDYNQMFILANERTDENTISIISNADIEFNQTCINQLKSIDYTDRILALTRWEKRGNRLVADNGLTQDAWVFKGKSKDINCDTKLGMPGCDHVIAYELNKHYDVRNPSLDVKIWHYDSEKTYTQAQRVRGAYLAIMPERLSELTTGKRETRKKLLIIQPGHFGDILICLPIAKYYSKDFDVSWFCPTQYHNLFRNINYCKPIIGKDWFGKQKYNMVLDLSFGLSKGNIDNWWNENQKRFASFVEAKYELADVDLSERNNLEFSRNIQNENQLFSQLNLEGKKYALVHEKSDYNKTTIFKTDLPKVYFKPIGKFNIFDWYKVIINATEIHCIDSSLANFVEVIKEVTNTPKFISEGINGSGVQMSIFNNNWLDAKTMELRIASNLVQEGAVTGTEFNTQLKKIIAERKPKMILETGTYLGNGSTRTILDAINENNLDTKFFSIECNQSFIIQAEKNLRSHPKKSQLKIMHGLSVEFNDLPKEITYADLPEDVIVDHSDPSEYLHEIRCRMDGIFKKIIALHGEPDFVLLDSAGHMGTIEFNCLMRLMTKPFILAIDDTKHFKHYRTLKEIKDDNMFKVITEGDEKFGFAICEYFGTVKELA